MKTIQMVKDVWEGMLQLIYPPQCLACQQTMEEPSPLTVVCLQCLETLSPVGEDFIRENILKRLDPCFLEAVTVFFQFNPVVQSIIHQIKYHKSNQLARRFAQFAIQVSMKVSWNGDELVIPVPLFREREKERGFNQSLYIARGFFQDSGLSIHPGGLIRSRHTRTQTELNRRERSENVNNAFILPDPAGVKGKSIILVDDVVTTGATLNECARILKLGGAEKVISYALATPVDETDDHGRL